MLILGIDSSGRQGSVGLLRAGGEEVITLGVEAIAGGQYSERLLTAVAELLARHGYERSEIGLIAVASGPGSFTGVRIAIATAKGLAEAHGAAIADVSVLEAIALASGMEGKLIAAMDAQRSEVFFGEYMVGGARPEQRVARMLREGIGSLGEISSLPGAGKAHCRIFTPDEGLAARLGEAGCEAELVGRPGAEEFARIGYGKFLKGFRADVAALDGNYLRRSDAEIFATPKLGVED